MTKELCEIAMRVSGRGFNVRRNHGALCVHFDRSADFECLNFQATISTFLRRQRLRRLLDRAKSRSLWITWMERN